MTKKKWYIIAPFISAVLIFLDQLTKYLARRDLSVLADGKYTLIDGVFSLTLSKNKGAAWGMFQDGTIFFSIVTILFSIALIYFFTKFPEGKRYHVLRIIAIMVFSGGIGNLIDRLFMGYVTDFLYIDLINFPIFNVADCYITWPMVLFFFLVLFYYKDNDLAFMGLKDDKKKDKDTEKESEVNQE